MKLIKTTWPHPYFLIILISLYGCNGEGKSSDTVNVASDSSDRETYVAYLQDSAIVIQSDSITRPVKLLDTIAAQVMNPAVSPDGQEIAYTRIMDDKDLRTICLMDLSTLERTQLAVPSPNFYGPVWSLDGERIAFNIFQKDSIWKIGVINRNNQGYRMLDSTSSINYYSPTWRSAEQVAAQDLEKLYTLNLDGDIIETILLDSLIGDDFSRSSDDQYYFTNDQTEIIFQIGNKEGSPDLMGPLQSVYRVRIADKKVTRLTPEGFHVRSLFIAKNDRIYCEGTNTPFTKFEWVELLPSGDLKQWSQSGTSTDNVINTMGSEE